MLFSQSTHQIMKEVISLGEVSFSTDAYLFYFSHMQYQNGMLSLHEEVQPRDSSNTT